MMNNKLFLLLSSGLLLMGPAAYSLDINTMSPDKPMSGQSVDEKSDFMKVNKPVSDTSADKKMAQDVKDAFRADKKLSNEASAVDVKVEGGIVTLSGKVSSPEMKKAFGDAAQHVKGVTKVVNNLTFGNK